ncbi:MAG: UDP-N-acetylmuramoyl-L-alanyl-D-glutamate--2,6-diaminopimelate ligase [Clostridia bacterium]|nr:UDP-N-acetylmuramoyl-L-alanyl-D-glutamate--2,6-diaminopimelate ligase [Clostridia bacterium]
MKLCELIKNMRTKEIVGNPDVEVKGLCTDSQMVKEGDLFVCYVGGKHDSHNDIAEITEKGAVAIICEHKLDCAVTQIIVDDGRAQIAVVARVFFGYPDKKLKIVGITGTNGKTTTAHMLAGIFKSNGNKCGLIGTLGISYGERFIAPELTTPDPIFLFSVLSDMVSSGVEYVFMEVSAHALFYDKVHGITFEVGVFTNCTQDHLDFFGNMNEYSACKMLMFQNGRCKHAVINSDDELGVKMLKNSEHAVSYGLKNPADVFAVDVDCKINGTKFVLNLFDELYEIKLDMPATHNVYNAMAAAACAKLLGVKTNVIARGLLSVKTVSGRLEHVAKFNGADIFVDFAHTPDGLEKSLQSLRKLCKGKLYCLFGCGGNRDKSKRPIMGGVAARYSDFCIVTSDNPRFEDPYDIISEIETGIKPTGKKYVTVTEREIATEYAIRLLEKDDILLVAGKGGEHYQEIMGIKHSYDDNTVIKNIIGD